MKRIALLVVVLAFNGGALLAAEPPGASAAAMETAFRDPPEGARPWAYWWWINGNVTEASIVRDLEAMKRIGFSGFLLFDARGYHDDHLPPPPPRTEFMSPQWQATLQFALKEAERLGLEASVNLSSCAGALRGPWPVGDDAPKRLVFASADMPAGRFQGEVPSGTWNRPKSIAVLAVRREAETVVEVRDLTGQVERGNALAWQVPAGRWTLLHFAQELMPGRENDVDILDAAAVGRHFERMARPILESSRRRPRTGRGGLTHFYSVSWEGAAPTWTAGFERQFRRRRGYDILRYLPALAGMTVESRQATERFWRDYHKTLGECFGDNCYGTLRELCRQEGLRWHSESGGPWDRKLPVFAHADQLAFLGQNDMPQGEFWYPERGFCRAAAMTAHIYGRPLAAAEAFTHMQPHWSVYPAILKPCADAAFCDGINHLVWHTFTASPEEFGRPGIEYFAGTHLNPNVTWFEQSRPFLQYLARCQWMLRQGRYVADACVYTGDKPYVHWGRGDKFSGTASLNLSREHSYDLLSTEVLLKDIAVRDGRLALPDGMNYRILIVDPEDETILPEALAKIAALARDGATVVLGRRPARAPGLTDYPGCDQTVRRLTDELWAQPGVRGFGKGRMSVGIWPAQVPGNESVGLDCLGPEGFTHRRIDATNERPAIDIYFVRGEGPRDVSYREVGRVPEIFCPVQGAVADAPAWCVENGRTVVRLDFPKNGATFVVFRRPGQAPTALPPPKPAQTVAPITGPWELRFPPGLGVPESIVLENLVPWNEHPVEGVKYFSGTATYRKAIRLDARQAAGPLRLNLGEVKHVAEVRLNGRSLGIVWTDPWSIELSGQRPGENVLEIAVTNVWVNRLVGDARMPEDRRITKTNARRKPGDKGRLAHLRGYGPDDPLVPSGLLGPVTLQSSP